MEFHGHTEMFYGKLCRNYHIIVKYEGGLANYPTPPTNLSRGYGNQQSSKVYETAGEKPMKSSSQCSEVRNPMQVYNEARKTKEIKFKTEFEEICYLFKVHQHYVRRLTCYKDHWIAVSGKNHTTYGIV